MVMRHAFTPPANYDLFRAAAAVSEQTRRAVRLAAEVDDDGQAWLLVTDQQTGEPVQVDPAVLDAVMQAEADWQPPPSDAERLAALEAELRGMRERAAALAVTGGAASVRDAITGL
jgi:hypothetical protein